MVFSHKCRLNTRYVLSTVYDGRTLISGEPWFHFNDGWVNGRFVQGWVKDYKDNNRWWYVEKGYN